MKYADDGYGNLVSIDNPYGRTTKVYAKVGNELRAYEVSTPDFLHAINTVREEIGNCHKGAVMAVLDAAKRE